MILVSIRGACVPEPGPLARAQGAIAKPAIRVLDSWWDHTANRGGT